MSNNWMTAAAAVTLISKQSHHPVSSEHVHTLVQRGKIGTRIVHGGAQLLKRSDVAAIRVAAGTGNHHRGDRAGAR